MASHPSQSRAWPAPDRQEALPTDPCVVFASYPSLSRPIQASSQCVLCDVAVLLLVGVVQAIDRRLAFAPPERPPERGPAVLSCHTSRSIPCRPGQCTVAPRGSSQE